MRRFTARFKSVMTTIGLFLVGVLLPDHGKRILMLTTLHMQLVSEGVFHEDALDKLNAAMDLTSSEDALMLPARVYSSIWERTALKESLHTLEHFDFKSSCLPYEEARKIAADIAMRAVPEWLKYGVGDQMLNDIIRLFYCQSSLSGAAAA